MKRIRKPMKKTGSRKPACYVLITCDEPAEDGRMQVEMTYEGDATIASYLLAGAQSIIEQECAPTNHSGKIHHLDCIASK